jgi:hypothetical protein
MLFTILVLALSTFTTAFADSKYYPTSFIQTIASGKVQNDDLKNLINALLTTRHLPDAKGGPDTLGCDSEGVNGCYAQRSLGYDGARRLMFGKLFLKNDGANNFYVEDVYCQKQFGAGAQVGPNAIPNQNQLNCEHTWPQSKFSRLYPQDLQKADLHHLFPADSKANSIRGNQDFADVSGDNGDLSQDKCAVSKFGNSTTSGSDGFEPPLTHKGNVARALFYFSVRYKIAIPKSEEEVLRRWNELDPVDQAEMDRNDAIFVAQANRNPFIDYPQLVNYISKF